MKKILTLLTLMVALSACNNDRAEEQALLDDVIKLHDTVMGKDEKLNRNRMKLDTIFRNTKDSTVYKLSAGLTNAESEMEDWMHRFDPEQPGKTHDQVVEYLKNQKKQVLHVDSVFDKTIAAADVYLKQLPK